MSGGGRFGGRRGAPRRPGHDVVGVTLHLGLSARRRRLAWSLLRARGSVRRAPYCDALGIPHSLSIDATVARRRSSSFVEPTSRVRRDPCTGVQPRGEGRRARRARAIASAAARIATGHYARLGRDSDGTPFLFSAKARTRRRTRATSSMQRAASTSSALPSRRRRQPQPEVRAEASRARSRRHQGGEPGALLRGAVRRVRVVRRKRAKTTSSGPGGRLRGRFVGAHEHHRSPSSAQGSRESRPVIARS